MHRPRLLQLLRIACSAACLIPCGISTWFCIRSFYWADFVNAHVHVIPIEILSADNKLKITIPRIERWNTMATEFVGAQIQSFSSDRPEASTISGHLSSFGDVCGFGVYKSSNIAFLVPHWFLIVGAVALAGVPWLKWSYRFSLRTLLVITAFVAIALALLVVAFR
jgi:hypothetical protein